MTVGQLMKALEDIDPSRPLYLVPECYSKGDHDPEANAMVGVKAMAVHDYDKQKVVEAVALLWVSSVFRVQP
jgi:hypothetical protein